MMLSRFHFMLTLCPQNPIWQTNDRFNVPYSLGY